MTAYVLKRKSWEKCIRDLRHSKAPVYSEEFRKPCAQAKQGICSENTERTLIFTSHRSLSSGQNWSAFEGIIQ